MWWRVQGWEMSSVWQRCKSLSSWPSDGKVKGENSQLTFSPPKTLLSCLYSHLLFLSNMILNLTHSPLLRTSV